MLRASRAYPHRPKGLYKVSSWPIPLLQHRTASSCENDIRAGAPRKRECGKDPACSARFSSASALGCFARPDERRHHGRSKSTPLLIDFHVAFTARVAIEQGEGLLVALWNLPPLEVFELRVVPAYRPLLCHENFSAWPGCSLYVTGQHTPGSGQSAYARWPFSPTPGGHFSKVLSASTQKAHSPGPMVRVPGGSGPGQSTKKSRGPF
jgi:hypothetical protein